MTTATPTAEWRTLYMASARSPSLVEVPPMMFLAIDGAGVPGDDDFRSAIGALYSIAYTAKFSLKKSGGPGYRLPPLEGLFTVSGDTGVDARVPRRLRWTLLIMQPAAVDAGLVALASTETARKRPALPVAKVRSEEFAEGLSAQVLHVGPYANEAPTIARLDAFIAEQGFRTRGRHHEIYLGDPRRSAPERLRTIIRHAVERPD